MSNSKTFWGTVDSFLTKIRKIFLNIVTVIVFLFITIGIVGSFGAMFENEQTIDKEDKVLWFKPTGVVVDTSTAEAASFESILNDSSVEQHQLEDLLKVLYAAADDKDLAAVYINVSELGMYYSSAFKLAEAVKKISESEKDVIAYAMEYDNTSYLISSQADRVFLNSMGGVSAVGFSRKREYYKDLYENLRINYHVFVAGDYKTGPEPFTRTDMSEEDKLAWREFADPLWNSMTDMMENARDLDEGFMQYYGDNLFELLKLKANEQSGEINAYSNALLAKDLNLVDELVTEESLRKWFYENYPNEDGNEYEFPDSIGIYDYLGLIDEEIEESDNKIAIVNIEGTITTGEAAFNIAGSDTIVKNIREATKNKSVKALVIRVNSPGGSVYASELITNALDEFKDSNRPIITSMGDIAASGGVWVTSRSEKIYAENETLTGSIGVYGMIPTIEGIYDWAGISVDGISSTKAGEWDPRLNMPQDVKSSIQAGVDEIYKKFVTKVSENRDMSYEEVHKIAKGRIWSGEQALQIGLVDEIGDINDAISYAAEILELDDYQAITYKKELDPFEIFIAEFLDNLDIDLGINKNLIDILDSKYKFIDLDKDLTTAVYCFVCDEIK
ncbi:MAG: signal peptide peptidase SppA [Gammaproteobacteria bacterium]